MAVICKELQLTSAAVRAAHHVHQEGTGKGAAIAEAPSANGTGCYRRKNCARCGKRFTSTPKRRMLCAGCFKSADSASGFDPGDGEGVGDLRTMPWRP